MGKSSSGKDTIYRKLLDIGELKLNRIITYTTRPIRENEKDGEEYYFTDLGYEEKLKNQGKLIESRSYMTACGRWDYFSALDGQVTPDRDYLVIGTIDSYRSLKNFYRDMSIVPIYINVEDGTRLERALARERAESEPKYEEMCRRFLADSVDFSEERLRDAGITQDHIFENFDAEDTVRAVAEYIRKQACRVGEE